MGVPLLAALVVILLFLMAVDSISCAVCLTLYYGVIYQDLTNSVLLD